MNLGSAIGKPSMRKKGWSIGAQQLFGALGGNAEGVIDLSQLPIQVALGMGLVSWTKAAMVERLCFISTILERSLIPLRNSFWL